MRRAMFVLVGFLGLSVLCRADDPGQTVKKAVERSALNQMGTFQNGFEKYLGRSRCVRSRHGDTRYQLLEGPDSTLLQFVLNAMEPIPAIDTFVESDWRIKRDTVNGIETVRVLAGYESPRGTFDPEHTRGYWFDQNGKLVKTYFSGSETRRSDFADFGGVQVAHTIQVFQNGVLGMIIHVTEVSPVGTVPEETFILEGHEWVSGFTSEVR